MSISNYAEAKILDAVFNATSFSVANTFIKLHIGDPGEDCTANPAAHTTRVAASWAAAAGGSLDNDAIINFTSLAASENISHISVWDAVTAGNPLWYGALTAPVSVIAGGELAFQVGTIDITLT